MTITTTQVTADEALQAVADGKSVQMIWMDDGKPFFSDFTAKIRDAMSIGETFLIVDVYEDDPTLMEMCEEIAKTLDISFENAEKIADSQQNFADTCENAAEVHPEEAEAKPSVLENFKPVKLRQQGGRKPLDDGKIMALYKAGWSAAKIADEMNASQQAIHAHLRKLREEGRL